MKQKQQQFISKGQLKYALLWILSVLGTRDWWRESSALCCLVVCIRWI